MNYNILCKVVIVYLYILYLSYTLFYNIGTRSYICSVSPQDLQYIWQYTSTADPPAPLDFLDAAEVIMEEKSLHMPTNTSEALSLFIELVSALED